MYPTAPTLPVAADRRAASAMPNARVIDSHRCSRSTWRTQPPCARSAAPTSRTRRIFLRTCTAHARAAAPGGAPKRRAKGADRWPAAEAKAEAPAATSANVPTTRSNSATPRSGRPRAPARRAKFIVRGLPRTPARAAPRSLAARSPRSPPQAPRLSQPGRQRAAAEQHAGPPFDAMQRHAQYASARTSREPALRMLANFAKEQTLLRDPATPTPRSPKRIDVMPRGRGGARRAPARGRSIIA